MLKEFFVPNKKNEYYPYMIRKPALSLYTVVLILFNLFSGALLPATSQEVAASSITPFTLVNLTNKERVSRGLNSLETNSQLTEAAYDKAADMFKKDYWDHFGPNGETPWGFINSEGYVYIYAGENLAKGFSTAEGVHQAWMASPTHKANIINSNYKEIGIAVAEGELQGEQVTLVVQMFGSQGTYGVTGSSESEPSTSGNSADQEPSETLNDETPDTERGEIKSISITSPAAGATISNPLTSIEGKVDFSKQTTGSYKVKISEGKTEIAEIESAQTTWVYIPENEWNEGENSLTASVGESKTTAKDTVSFMVDTTPPDFDEDSLVVYFNPDLDQWSVKLYSVEEGVTAHLTTGEKTFNLTPVSRGQYLLAVIPSEIVTDVEEVKLTLTDTVGNERTESILGEFTSSQTTEPLDDATGQKISLLASFRALSTKSQINVLFGFFLTLLLLVQIYYYKKHGILSDHGGYVVTAGFMVVIILVATVSGPLGSIV